MSIVMSEDPAPDRRQPFPLRARDLFWATVLVAVVAGASLIGLEFGHA